VNANLLKEVETIVGAKKLTIDSGDQNGTGSPAHIESGKNIHCRW